MSKVWTIRTHVNAIEWSTTHSEAVVDDFEGASGTGCSESKPRYFNPRYYAQSLQFTIVFSKFVLPGLDDMCLVDNNRHDPLPKGFNTEHLLEAHISQKAFWGGVTKVVTAFFQVCETFLVVIVFVYCNG